MLDIVFHSVDADLTLDGMDTNLSDTEPDQYAASEAGLESNFDSDADLGTDLHPALCTGGTGISLLDGLGLGSGEPDTDGSSDLDEGIFAASDPNLPEVVQKLRLQLLSGYTLPIFPPLDGDEDPMGRSLTPAEELSLKHFIAWVDSRGTVKAYQLHAQVLHQATGMDILSLYMARKLAMELTKLSSQLVDMCPRSCMAFTGEFKGLHKCIYVRDKRHPCGQPCYDKKGHPRAQMLYTPIAPVIQSFYKNKKMAKAMLYRHEHLQKALKELKPNSSPTTYFDFSNTINHINHFQDLQLFQNETDTAITISGDGAQLTMKKQSDVWVLIVTILNLPPDMRSRANNIIIPLVIPGPSSPGNVESFIYPLYEELAKLSVGVWTWNALSETFFPLKVFLCGVLGDMLGSAKLSKMAGHMALYGCRFSMVRGARSSKDRGMI